MACVFCAAGCGIGPHASKQKSLAAVMCLLPVLVQLLIQQSYIQEMVLKADGCVLSMTHRARHVLCHAPKDVDV